MGVRHIVRTTDGASTLKAFYENSFNFIEVDDTNNNNYYNNNNNINNNINNNNNSTTSHTNTNCNYNIPVS